MSQPAIEVTGLGKRYVIEHESRHDSLRDTLHHSARKLWRRFRWGTGFQTEEFWALRDVSFAINPGEVVGIIGRNGAGKSTLLKILSRITEPTAGTIRLRGRVASLLEVGTGFHPDLTGRENIFLNGAILGMSRAEIRRKFDEIVAFAEIERFLDTPVKRYSSGMYVRLAFAVAAHLEPEILIVDEVLAVGDAAFQKKCLGKMQDISLHQGRTVLFVSHQLSAIEALTNRALVLEKGSLYADAETPVARNLYLDLIGASGTRDAATWGRGEHAQIMGVTLLDTAGQPQPAYVPGEPFRVAVDVQTDGHAQLSLELFLKADGTTRIGMASLWHLHNRLLPAQPGKHRCVLDFGSLPLATGTYFLDVATSVPNVCMDHEVENALAFEVPLSLHGTPPFNFKKSYGFGCLALPCIDIRSEPAS